MTLANCLIAYAVASIIGTVIILCALRLHAKMERQDEQ